MAPTPLPGGRTTNDQPCSKELNPISSQSDTGCLSTYWTPTRRSSFIGIGPQHLRVIATFLGGHGIALV